MKKEAKEILKRELKTISEKYELSINPKYYDSEIRKLNRAKKLKIPYFYNIIHFSKFTGFSIKELSFFIHNNNKGYVTFEIPKRRKGKRIINAPTKKLKKIQRWILDNILYQIDPGKYAYGFIPGKSIKNNAEIHVGKDLICGIDLKDYFPSITINRVIGFFKSIGYNKVMAYNFSKLTTFLDKIPQGAPTSPMIANLISWRMDMKIASFCENRGLEYSRYADDITISGDKTLPKYVTLIKKKIKDQGFEINEDKLRIIGQGSAQKITGIIVNEIVGIGRDKKRRLKAIVHNINKNGPLKENREKDPFFKERIFGQLGYAKMIDSNFADPLIKKLKKVDWENYDKHNKIYIKEEELKRELKKSIKHWLVNFKDLGFFKDIDEIPVLTEKEVDEIAEKINELLEKCKKNVKKEECQDCLIKPSIDKYKKCMKYILGKYIGNTGGVHHGHEKYDIGGHTELFGNTIFVEFLLKSYGWTPEKKNSLFKQFYECIEFHDSEVVSIVTPDNIDHDMILLIKRAMRKADPEKKLCMIVRSEMRMIYNDFKKQILTEK